MSFRSDLRYPRLWFAGWILMLFAIVVGSMMPAADVPVPMAFGMDKVVHLLGYAVVALYAANLFRGRTILIVALILIGVGGIVEIAQGLLTATRSAELADFAVDSVGVVAGALIAQRTSLGSLLSRIEAMRSRIA